MLCLSGFELYSRCVPLVFPKAPHNPSKNFRSRKLSEQHFLGGQSLLSDLIEKR